MQYHSDAVNTYVQTREHLGTQSDLVVASWRPPMWPVRALDPLNANLRARPVRAPDYEQIQVFTVNYNIMRLMAGFGGLAYADNDTDRPTTTDRRPSNTNASVYHNAQNVHATSISNSIKESARNLQSDPEPNLNSVLDEVMGSNLRDQAKGLVSSFYRDSTTCSSTGLALSKLIAHVWQRIQNPLVTPTAICNGFAKGNGFAEGSSDPDSMRTELLRIFEERVNDCIERGSEVCFGGKFSRIISTLDGFFTDIRISISDSERITAIVLQIRDGLEPYDAKAHAVMAKEQLIEAGFESSQFEAWITEIIDIT